MPETIEDIILDHDKRGMLALRPHLPPDFCSQAAGFVMDHPGDVVIVTGFYITMSGGPETDGPPGAVAIGEALQALGRQVKYVSDAYTTPVLQSWVDHSNIVDFPIAGIPESKQQAADILDRIKPSLLISIERCGRNRDDSYLNMRSRDISPQTARLDYLFDHDVPSVGIGDGGNEIGMGNLVDVIPAVETLPDLPAVSTVDRLIVASVSNWGGYGLVAGLSRLAGKNLLPSVEHETRIITAMVEAGAVDGTTGNAIPTVDDFTVEENAALLGRLHRLVDAG